MKNGMNENIEAPKAQNSMSVLVGPLEEGTNIKKTQGKHLINLVLHIIGRVRIPGESLEHTEGRVSADLTVQKVPPKFKPS